METILKILFTVVMSIIVVITVLFIISFINEKFEKNLPGCINNKKYITNTLCTICKKISQNNLSISEWEE
jgi:hypothetical protein